MVKNADRTPVCFARVNGNAARPVGFGRGGGVVDRVTGVWVFYCSKEYKITFVAIFTRSSVGRHKIVGDLAST